MSRIIEENLFLVAGLVMVLSFCQSRDAVISFLIAIIFTEVSVCVENDKVKLGLLITFVLLCLQIINLIFFVPIMLYDSTWNGKLKRNIVALLILMLVDSDVSDFQIAGLIVSCVLAIALSYEASRAEAATAKELEAVDTAKIMENELKSKNRELLDNQYASIHVATLQERNRIAREIHDNVGHMLSRTILQMGALMTIYKEEPLHGQLESVSDTLNEAMNNIRESIHDLHDESIDLKLAIYEAVSDMKSYAVKVDYDMSNNVPRNVKYCLISIVKEAMSNIVKHSDADKVDVLLREHPGFYQMVIEDNGSVKNKKNTDKNSEAGIGLKNMTDRVEALSGTITISRDKGFRILISIPKSSK